jgi:hypothetical protein
VDDEARFNDMGTWMVVAEVVVGAGAAVVAVDDDDRVNRD